MSGVRFADDRQFVCLRFQADRRDEAATIVGKILGYDDASADDKAKARAVLAALADPTLPDPAPADADADAASASAFGSGGGGGGGGNGEGGGGGGGGGGARPPSPTSDDGDGDTTEPARLAQILEAGRLLRAGTDLHKAQRIPEAIATFQNVLGLEGVPRKERAKAYTCLGSAYASAGDSKGAIESWRRANLEDPRCNNRAWKGLSAALKRRGLMTEDGELDFGGGSETAGAAAERARMRSAFLAELSPDMKGLVRERVARKYLGGPGKQTWFKLDVSAGVGVGRPLASPAGPGGGSPGSAASCELRASCWASSTDSPMDSSRVTCLDCR